MEERYIKRCESGLGSNASSGGRLTLLNANISSIAFYYLSMFLLSKTMIARLDKHRRRFFGKFLRIGKGIIWSNGPGSVDLKTKGGWELKTCINRISVCPPSGGGNWRPKMVYGKILLRLDIFEEILLPQLKGKPATPHVGRR